MTTCACADASMQVASNDEEEEEKVPCMMLNEVEVHREDSLGIVGDEGNDEDDVEETLRTQKEEEEDHVGRNVDNDDKRHGEAEEEPSYSYHTEEGDLIEGMVCAQRRVDLDHRTCDGVVDSP